MARRRAARVIEQAVQFDEFQLPQLQAYCSEERPSYVTRIVNQLVREGVLLQLEPRCDRRFRWLRCRATFSVSEWLTGQAEWGRVKDTPQGDRPRERLLTAGVDKLRTAELLAILIRTGRPGESALQAGEKIANRYADNLDSLGNAGCGELRAISAAAHRAAYCQIMAGIELGQRVARARDRRAPRRRIRGSADAAVFCQEHFERLAREATQEEMHVVCLSTKNEVIATHCVTIGTLDASLVHPREVFRPAIKDAAAAVILVHNHPSGDPTPSNEDVAVTMRLEAAGEQIGIDVLDHIVVGRDAAVSIRDYLGSD
ncbi:MAG: DNA repair protein RadC [Planctomycetales bacterium]|nr:DNA repair protein RadC [Planctomycetales bacterium]